MKYLLLISIAVVLNCEAAEITVTQMACLKLPSNFEMKSCLKRNKTNYDDITKGHVHVACLSKHTNEDAHGCYYIFEMAEEHGWPNWQHINAIENGHKDVSISTLKRLAKLYGVSLSELIKGL